jgi:hypothetical protein
VAEIAVVIVAAAAVAAAEEGVGKNFTSRTVVNDFCGCERLFFRSAVEPLPARQRRLHSSLSSVSPANEFQTAVCESAPKSRHALMLLNPPM